MKVLLALLFLHLLMTATFAGPMCKITLISILIETLLSLVMCYSSDN